MPPKLESPDAAFWAASKEKPPVIAADTSARDGGSVPEKMPDPSTMKRLTVEKPGVQNEQAIDLGTFGKAEAPVPPPTETAPKPERPSVDPAFDDPPREIPSQPAEKPETPPAERSAEDPFNRDVSQRLQQLEKDLGQSKTARMIGNVVRYLSSMERNSRPAGGMREKVAAFFEKIKSGVEAAREGAASVGERIQSGEFTGERKETRMNREANIMRAYEALKKTPRLQEEVSRIQQTIKATGLGEEFAELALADKFGPEVAPALVWLMERPQLQGFIDNIKGLNLSPELEEKMLAKKIEQLEAEPATEPSNEEVKPATEKAYSAQDTADMLHQRFEGTATAPAETESASEQRPEQREQIENIKAIQDTNLAPEDVNQLNAEIYGQLLAASEPPANSQRQIELQNRNGEAVRASVDEKYNLKEDEDPQVALQRIIGQQDTRLKISAEMLKADKSAEADKLTAFEDGLKRRFGAENVTVEIPEVNGQPAQAWTEGMRMRTELENGKIMIRFEEAGAIGTQPKFESEVSL